MIRYIPRFVPQDSHLFSRADVNSLHSYIRSEAFVIRYIRFVPQDSRLFSRAGVISLHVTIIMTSKTYTLTTALARARKYCAYQERSQQEVRDKLYDLGLHKNEVEQGIAILIEDGFLNEQRFAVAFAGGKFRINKWGKVKIRLALKAKKISDYCIRHALNQIPANDYEKALSKVLDARRKKLPGSDSMKINYQLAQYAIGRGFEADLVWNQLNINK